MKSGTYTELTKKWKKGDQIELILPMEAQLVEANPLVEEVRNQMCIQIVSNPLLLIIFRVLKLRGYLLLSLLFQSFWVLNYLAVII